MISALARFPVKSCGAEPLTRADLAVDGVRHDRLLAVVAGDKILTQREHAVLATVRPTLDDESMTLTLRCVDDSRDGPASVVRTDGPRRVVSIFSRPVEVVDQSPELSAWFSDLLGTPAQLVAAPETTRRTSPGAVTGLTLLSDEGTLSVHSLASLDRLNRRLAEAGADPLPADRFRANVVLDGCPAHAEDETDCFEVGPVVLRFAQQDARCVMTTIDQRAGRRAGPEPIRSLAGYRRGPDGGVLFGVYVAVEQGGVVRVGDRVRLDGS